MSITRTSLPPTLTVGEFSYLTRRHPETIRRAIRAKNLKSNGRPASIPVRELAKYGVDLDLAAESYRQMPATNALWERLQREKEISWLSVQSAAETAMLNRLVKKGAARREVRNNIPCWVLNREEWRPQS